MSKAITLQEFIMDTQAEFPFLSGQLNMLEENAGDILTKQPKHLHDRSPFYVGNVNMVHGPRSCWLDTGKTG